MRTIRLGVEGDEVTRLQSRLREIHFNPGEIDGNFGPATLAAVIGFQKSKVLLPDGIVGSRTAKALGLVKSAPINSVLPHVTTTVVSHMFPHTQVDNIKNNLPYVLDGLVDYKLTERPMVLMELSTIRDETDRKKGTEGIII